MSKRIYIISLFFSPLLLVAQVVSNGGRFQADYALACNPFTINITSLDNFGNITRQYFYEEGATETTATTYTYSSPGIYEIVQVVGIDVTPKTDTLIIEVIDPTPTQYSVEKCNLNGISVTSLDQTYDFMRVYFTPTDSATILFGETASFNYGSPTSQTFETKGFYTNAKENCTSFSQTIDAVAALSTPSIQSTSIKETCRNHFVLEVELDAFDSEINYQVELSQTSASIIYEGSIDSTYIYFQDIPYSTSEDQYCVKINALDNCTRSVVEGTELCQTITELSATPFGSLYSSYVSNGILINMDSVNSGSLQISRKREANNAFEFLRSTQQSFIDQVSLSRTYFYQIDYLDSCGEVLHSTETNPPLISSRTLDENSYSITYTDPVNMLTGLSSRNYVIGNETTTTEPIVSQSFQVNLDATNGTRQFLQVNVAYEDGTTIYSNQLTYKYQAVIYVPSAFTPNGDDLNDTLELYGLPTEEATTRIYTKWGQLIYQSEEPAPGWDGLINGSLAPEGVYLYEVIFLDSDGVKVIQKGTFALLKK